MVLYYFLTSKNTDAVIKSCISYIANQKSKQIYEPPTKYMIDDYFAEFMWNNSTFWIFDSTGIEDSKFYPFLFWRSKGHGFISRLIIRSWMYITLKTFIDFWDWNLNSFQPFNLKCHKANFNAGKINVVFWGIKLSAHQCLRCKISV